MESLTLERRMTAFRALDAFAVDAYRAASAMPVRTASALIDEIRRAALVAGGALVAASASPAQSDAERRHLQRARVALVESRYYLYLARRFGLLDARRYRGLTVRQDAAVRELDSVLEGGRVPAALRPP